MLPGREGGAESDPRYSVVGHVFMRHFVFGLNVALSSLLLLLLADNFDN